MNINPVFPARMTFAFINGYHISFFTFTIDLSAWLATINGVRLLVDNAAVCWPLKSLLKAFALPFDPGEVNGIGHTRRND
jgi:cytochrome bd-type quinol oxidase subunit 1